MTQALAWLAGVSAALAVLGGLLILALIVRRAIVNGRQRRAQAIELRVQEHALALVHGADGQLPDVPARETEVFAALVHRYGRHLRGEPRAAVAAFFESRGAVRRSLRHLRSTRTWRRAEAAHALGDFASASAVGPLINALKSDRQRVVRSAAARSLGSLGAPEAVEPLVEALVLHRAPRSVAAHALLQIGVAALPALRELQRHPDPATRGATIELIGFLGEAADAGSVAAALRDPSAEARAKAARALGRLGAASAAVSLRSTLDDRIPFVRVNAAHALGDIGDRAAVPKLLELARADTHDAARAAAHAVARIDPVALSHAAQQPAAGQYLYEAADLSAAGLL